MCTARYMAVAGAELYSVYAGPGIMCSLHVDEKAPWQRKLALHRSQFRVAQHTGYYTYFAMRRAVHEIAGPERSLLGSADSPAADPVLKQTTT